MAQTPLRADATFARGLSRPGRRDASWGRASWKIGRRVFRLLQDVEAATAGTRRVRTAGGWAKPSPRETAHGKTRGTSAARSAHRAILVNL